MKETRLMWDMPITVEVAETAIAPLEIVYSYFEHIDAVFNIFRQSSEISQINRGEIPEEKWSDEMKEVLALCEKTRDETYGYFEHKRNGFIDPLGLVKGWAIQKGVNMLEKQGFKNFYIDAGGDVQVNGTNDGKPWTIGIRNPFNRFENVKILSLTDCGIATSGTYIRGDHISNPFSYGLAISDIVSLTVIGPDVYEADRFATAAFAMGKQGIYFIEKMFGLEGYIIDKNGTATYTSGFEKYIQQKDITNSFTPLHL